MRKCIRQWVKEEKRIVKLIYQKGLMDSNSPAIEDLYWAEYRTGKLVNKRRRRRFNYRNYLPEIHYGYCDYCGEYDEHGFIALILEGLHWAHVSPEWIENPNGVAYPTSDFNYKGRKWFIKYLKALPTVNRSSKINRLLIRNKE